MKKIILIFAISLLSACAGDQFKNDIQANKALKKIWSGYFAEDFNDTKAIDIAVVTNRRATNNSFGCAENSFGVNGVGTLQYGICRVNVPKNHSTGDIAFTKDNRQSSNDYFKILEAKNITSKNLIESLKKNNRTPLVFVHGFNVKFGEAVLRSSQIAYDLKYQGPIVLFTWPAGAEDGFFANAMMNKTYENNLVNARNSVVLFKNFLSELEENDIQVNLVVHSMGHQVVLPALKQLADTNSESVINELILNAPDFDAQEFKVVMKDIKKVSGRITLYCSYNDKAMFASKTFNNNERLGACTFAPDLDSINVSLVDNSTLGLGHGYYSSRTILTDVFQTLLGIDADKRLFVRKSEMNSTEKYFLRN
jgi:esterase/lipase superfamily enzyme